MKECHQTIALLLGEAGGERWQPRSFVAGAQRLVRGADGCVRLEAIANAQEFDATARTTGCFRRGKPIHDPATHEVIGYEMEEVPLLRPTTWG
ncbi:MAG: hypothetical protein OEQ25_00235 [Gammaproteobacteria bacterium]|nr:hypothetical protein [Gammaproteobacteria bacterium]MDH3505539.1 hypothetical protein [Gammaproteobacteria bacterium]